jgi:hypothetical protein
LRIATAIVGDADLAAVHALLDMPVERRVPERLDGGDRAALVNRQPQAVDPGWSASRSGMREQLVKESGRQFR